jgi:spore maturation protein CgeB
MRVVFYTHSLVSDWNHGNAHFLRGVMRELIARGHDAVALEPANGWSRANLVGDQGPEAETRFAANFPMLRSVTYDAAFDHEAELDHADVVIVHEWADPALIARLGRAREQRRDFRLLFHDTHHRAVSAERDLAALDLSNYDAVLAFGATLRDRYLAAGWGRNVHVWHEAADTALFHPLAGTRKTGDFIWIGNWGDGERTAEIDDYIIRPVSELRLSATIRGVRYPDEALQRLRAAHIRFGGWIANADVPLAFAQHRVTVHVPRRPYVEALPGIPTIRMFEALACGIPLLSAPWQDSEDLFRPGEDFLFVRDGAEMVRRLRDVLNDGDLAASLAMSGLKTILTRHTCGHRVEQLLSIIAQLRSGAPFVEEVAA